MIALLLTQSYLLISPFVYSGAMALWFYPELSKSEAGYTAGFIASSFMAGRTLSSYHWGLLSDTYGRKSVLLLTMSTSAVINITLGFCTNFYAFVFFRFTMGFFNCVPGTLKTIISEAARGDRTWESDTMGLVFGMWGVGFLIGPLISGGLADPITQYPDLKLVQQNAVLTPLLTKFPYLLPNLFGGVISAICVLWLHVSLEETLSRDVLKPLPWCCRRGTDGLEWIEMGEGVKEEVVESAEPVVEKPRTTIYSLMKRPTTRSLLIIYWVFSFVITTTDEMVPLYGLADNAGGLHLMPKSIGTFLSAAGVLYVLCQYRMYKFAIGRLGRRKTMLLGTAVFGPLSLLVPCALLIPGDEAESNHVLGWPRFFYLGFVIGLNRAFASMHFSSVSLLMNESVEEDVRGTMNGLSTLGGSVAKGAAPLFAGVCYAYCVNNEEVWSARAGAFIAFATTASFAVVIAAVAMRDKSFKGERFDS